MLNTLNPAGLCGTCGICDSCTHVFFSAWAIDAAPAVHIKLLVAKEILQPRRKWKEVDEHRAPQAQAAQVLPDPQPTQVLQVPCVSLSVNKEIQDVHLNKHLSLSIAEGGDAMGTEILTCSTKTWWN